MWSKCTGAECAKDNDDHAYQKVYKKFNNINSAYICVYVLENGTFL